MPGLKPLCRVVITDMEKVSVEEWRNIWLRQEKYIDFIEAKVEEKVDPSEFSSCQIKHGELKAQRDESAARMKTLNSRLTKKEQECSELCEEVKKKNLRNTLLDPVVNMMYQRMREEIVSLRAHLKEMQEELNACDVNLTAFKLQIRRKIDLVMSLMRLFKKGSKSEKIYGSGPPAPPLSISIPTKQVDKGPRVITPLNMELDFSVVVITDREEKDLGRLLTPLIHLQIDYVGREYKALWLAFAVISGFELAKGESRSYGCMYKKRLCKGVQIWTESDKFFETAHEFQWSQHLHYLADGTYSDWTFCGKVIRTFVNYKPQLGTAEMIDWLISMGVRCRLGENDELILIV